MAKPLLVGDLMTRSVFSVRPADSVAKARMLMDKLDVRHVPVVDAEQDLVGLLSERDLLRHALEGQLELPISVQEDLLAKTRVEDIMTREVATAEAEDPLARAAGIMLENKYGCLPVVEGLHLVGILTESDFVRHFEASRAARKAPSKGARRR